MVEDSTSAFGVGEFRRPGWIRLMGPLNAGAIETAASQLAALPEAQLFLTGVQDTDLGFLADLPPLHSLEVILSGVRDVSALAGHSENLQHLHLELGRHPVAVDVLASLPHLRKLYLRKEGAAAVKGAPEAIARATGLEHLVLHSVSLPSLAPLTAMPRLRGLALKLGAAPDLTAFPELAALHFFEAWQVRGMSDLRPVAASSTLEVLWLESLRQAVVPDLSGAVSLAHIRIDNLPLTDGLAGVAAAPHLRQLYITRRVFDPHEVEVLRGHPSLRAASFPLRGSATEG